MGLMEGGEDCFLMKVNGQMALQIKQTRERILCIVVRPMNIARLPTLELVVLGTGGS